MSFCKIAADAPDNAFQFVGFLQGDVAKTQQGKNVCPFGYKIAVFTKSSLNVDFTDSEGFYRNIAEQALRYFLVPDIEATTMKPAAYRLLNHMLVYKELHWIPLQEEQGNCAGMIDGYLVRAIPWYLGSHLDRMSELAIHKTTEMAQVLPFANPDRDLGLFETQFLTVSWFVHYYYYLERIHALLLHAKTCLGRQTANAQVANVLIELHAHDCALTLQKTILGASANLSRPEAASKAMEHWFDMRKRIQFPGIAADAYKVVYPTLNDGIGFSGTFKQFFENQIFYMYHILPVELLEKRTADLIEVPTLSDSVEYPVLDLSDANVFMCTYAQEDFGIFALEFKENDGSHEQCHSNLLKTRLAWYYVDNIASTPGSRYQAAQSTEVWKGALHPFVQKQCFPAFGNSSVNVPYVVWQWKSSLGRSVNFESPCDDIAAVLQAIHEKDKLYPWVHPKLLQNFLDFVKSVTGPEGGKENHNAGVQLLATDAPGYLFDENAFKAFIHCWEKCMEARRLNLPIQVSFCAPQLISSLVNEYPKAPNTSDKFIESGVEFLNRIDEGGAANSDNRVALYITQPEQMEVEQYWVQMAVTVSCHVDVIIQTRRIEPIVTTAICLPVWNDYGPVTQMVLTAFEPFQSVSPALAPKIATCVNSSISALSTTITFPTWLRIYEERTAPSLLALASRFDKIDNYHVLYIKELIEALPFKVQFVKAIDHSDESAINVPITTRAWYAAECFADEETRRQKRNLAPASHIKFYYRAKGKVSNMLPISTLFRTIFLVANKIPVSAITLNVIVDSEIPEDATARAHLVEIARHFYTL